MFKSLSFVIVYIIILLMVPFSFTSCARIKTEFIDVDGTSFSQTLLVPPFSKLAESASKMTYTWSPMDGSVTVGQDTSGVDTTGQIKGVTALLLGLQGLIDSSRVEYITPIPSVEPIL